MDISLSQNVGGSLAVLAAYVVAFSLSQNRISLALFLACLSSQALAFTDIYILLLELYPEKTFQIYSAIYSTVVFYIYADSSQCYTSRKLKILVICFTMALFELIACRAYTNELGSEMVEKWTYDNYEIIVTCLHGLIVFQMVHWSRIGRNIRDFCHSLFSSFVHNGLSLYF